MAYQFLAFNDGFSVRKCVVKCNEKIMISSYGETSGFSAVTSEELEKVNGGLPAVLGVGIITVGYFIGYIAYQAATGNKKSK